MIILFEHLQVDSSVGYYETFGQRHPIAVSHYPFFCL